MDWKVGVPETRGISSECKTGAPFLKVGVGGSGLSMPAGIWFGSFDVGKVQLLLPVMVQVLSVPADGCWAGIDTDNGWEVIGTEVRRQDVGCILECDTPSSSSFLDLDMRKAPLEELLPALEEVEEHGT
jgi:hypothetical protein